VRKTLLRAKLDEEVINKIEQAIDYNHDEVFYYQNADLTKTIFVSPAYERIWGDTRENLYANPLSFMKAIISEDQQRVIDSYKAYLESGFLDIEYRIIDKVGKQLWIHATSKPVVDRGTVIGHIGRATDITKHKEYELELEKKEQYLTSILNTQSELICRYKVDSTLLFVNRAYCNTFDADEQELLGKKYIMFLPENQRLQEFEWIKRISIENPIQTKEYELTLPNGSQIWLKWTDHGIFDSNGELSEIVGVGVNITSEKTYRIELEIQNEKLLTAQMNANLGLYSVDLTNNTAVISDFLSDILEIERKNEHDLSVWEKLLHPADRERTLKEHAEIIEANKPYQLKYRVVTEKGKKVKWIYDIGKIEFVDNIPVKLYGTMMDISNLQTLESELENIYRKLQNSYKETIKGWAHALSLKDDETEHHSERVTELSVALASYIGYPEDKLEQFEYGALLHDIGKMGIPDSILLKPGKLTDEEFAEIKKHPIYAYDMLSKVEFLRDALDIPYSHHEKWDGSGYPQGLKGEEIPLAARIFAIIDVLDALTSDRPYRKAWSSEKTIDYIKEQSGTHFDPMIVKEFLELISKQEIKR
jgi:PAS domain S-box-containing protein